MKRKAEWSGNVLLNNNNLVVPGAAGAAQDSILKPLTEYKHLSRSLINKNFCIYNYLRKLRSVSQECVSEYTAISGSMKIKETECAYKPQQKEADVIFVCYVQLDSLAGAQVDQ